eukprot:2700044-Lingulodinium_polyedra.AAC.1
MGEAAQPPGRRGGADRGRALGRLSCAAPRFAWGARKDTMDGSFPDASGPELKDLWPRQVESLAVHQVDGHNSNTVLSQN